jgi:CHAT domain-containing protein/tetratricopeptide (TPR) repeat protein
VTWVHLLLAWLLLSTAPALAQPALDPAEAMAILRGTSVARPATREPAIRQLLQQAGPGASAVPLLRVVLGANLLAQARYEDAEAVTREALADRVDPQFVPLVTAQLADILLAQGRVRNAQELLRTALAGADDAEPRNWSEAYLVAALARTHLTIGDLPGADALLLRALPVLQSSGTWDAPETQWAEADLFRIQVRRGSLSDVYRRTGPDLLRFLAYPEQLSTPLQADHLEAHAEFLELSNLDRSEAALRKVLAFRRQLLSADHPLVARAAHLLARNLLLQGKDRQAEALAREALAAREAKLAAEHPDRAASLDLLARVFRRQGRDLEAEALWRRGLALLQASSPLLRAPLMVGLGEHLAALGRDEEALPLLAQGIELLQKLPNAVPTVEGILAFTALQLRGDQCPDPGLRAMFHQLAALPEFFSAAHLEPRFRQEVARILACEGRYREARDAFQRAFSALLGRVDMGDSADTQVLSARAAMALSRSRETLDDASRWALQAAGFARRWLQGSGDAARNRAMAEVFQAQLEVAWQQQQLGDQFAPTYRSEGFMAAQDLEVSSAARALAQTAARLAAGSPALADLVRRQQNLSVRSAALDAESVAASVRGNSADAAQARAALKPLSEELARVEAELDRGFPNYRELVQPRAVSVLDLQKRLQPGEAALLLVPGGADVHVFAVTKTRHAWHRASEAAEPTRRRTERLRCQLDSANCGSSGADAVRGLTPARPHAVPAAATGPFDRTIAHALYRDLLAPVEPVLRGVQRLYVTATGPLGTLPLALLPTDAQGTQWLGDKYVLVSLPSVSSLRAFERAAQPGASARGLALVGFGDPVLSGPSAASRGVPEPVRRFQAAEGGGRVDPALVRQLQPLPGTRRELAAMTQLFPPEQAVVRLGAQATEQQFKSEPSVGQAEVLVFATHGLLPRELGGLEEPGLVFTPPAEASTVDDGVLTASEVAQLSLRADWVILSACNTASSNTEVGGESLSGLTRAFLYAGARAVLASHWRVEDDVTATLTVQTLRARRDNPSLGRAEALQRAMRAVRTGVGVDGQRIAGWQPGWAQPAAWAPFVVVATE